MTYLDDFQAQLNSRNYSKFLQLWEEYCNSDHVDVEEFKQILLVIKNSDFSKQFGTLVETALPLWKMIQEKNDSYSILKLLIDLQNTNTPLMADLTYQALKDKYTNDPQFNDRIRLIGLRTRDNFQGALSNYDLLQHMQQGKFVFHSAGWGTGEIVEVSTLRQQVTIEFENVSGRKHLTFDNAFKSIIPLPEDHFQARRFANPDDLEKEAKEDPVRVIKLLLKDRGPKSAAEIKEELCELVIPEKEWVKWWQAARVKLKKDPLVETPEALKNPFRLRKSARSSEEILNKAIQHHEDIDAFIQSTYTLLRDLTTKNQDIRDSIKEKLLNRLADPAITPEQELQIAICLEGQFNHLVEGKAPKILIKKLNNVEESIHAIDIVALKKRALILVKEQRKDWVHNFINIFLSVKHSAIKDYLCKELNQKETKKQFHETIDKLLLHPERHPECFLWLFLKIVKNDDSSLPYSNKEGQCKSFESFLILMSKIENKPEYKDLTKKLYNFLSEKRYALVRTVMEGSSLEFIKECLLLASKCHTLNDHDKKILHSLASVVHPSLGKQKSHEQELAKAHILWTTEDGYLKTQDQIRRIGTIEIIENAREIESARSLGDLRENSEYKFALEKRSRLQSQLKTLSEQLGRARIITKDDIHPTEVGVGSIVDVVDGNGNQIVYTILGPWDADIEQNILSFQSQLAQAMLGCKKGETFKFRNQTLKVGNIQSYLEK